MMLHRYCYLKSDIVANEIKLNCSLKFRVLLLICDIGIQCTQCTLIFLCKDCEQYHHYILMILLINIITLFLQIFLMIFEYKKRVPLFFAHKLYWIANWIVLFIIAIMIINQQGYLTNTLYLILGRIILISILLIYTLFIRKQDLVEFEDIGFFNSELPDIDISSLDQKLRISTLNNFQTQLFQVELQKIWNIVDNDIEIKLNIHLIDKEKSMKLKKRVSQLFEMHQKLIIECQVYFELHNNDLIQLDYLIKQISDNTDLQLINNIQKYFNILISKVDLISNTFLDFIEFPQQERELLNDLKLQNPQIHKSSLVKKQQIHLSYKKWELHLPYIPYMDVQIKEHQKIKLHGDSYIQYFIVIKINKQNLISQKRFSEFHELNEQLKQQGIKYSSLFPQKSIGKLTELDIEERQKDLEIYLKVLLNDRNNHNCLTLFKFVGLSINQETFLQKQYYRIQKDIELVSQSIVKFLQYEDILDQNGDKYFKYQFQIINNNFFNSFHIISKRYSQFDELHSILKQRVQFLPLLPQKQSALSQYVNPNQRSVLLLQYLNELIKNPQVCENPHFRQFIDIPFFQFESDEITISESKNQYNQSFRYSNNYDSIITKIEDMKIRLWD
ncbi:unnamed protein product [Paramecium pentaurelia]|uniref:PX domain-containing protein n=1 Tax=Paramecium pentaurelia TaxID=43138 RepID=A0A8S1XSE9_9CILI|nr:unnamed protein product [Paramecium pentaurelia]